MVPAAGGSSHELESLVVETHWLEQDKGKVLFTDYLCPEQRNERRKLP